MFTVTFNTGKTVSAHTVDERYDVARSEIPTYAMTIRVTDVTEDLAHYADIVTEAGALDSIVVTDELNTINTYTGYTVVSSITRNLVPGGATINISLTRSAE